jgi:hypothetical protein
MSSCTCCLTASQRLFSVLLRSSNVRPSPSPSTCCSAPSRRSASRSWSNSPAGAVCNLRQRSKTVAVIGTDTAFCMVMTRSCSPARHVSKAVRAFSISKRVYKGSRVWLSRPFPRGSGSSSASWSSSDLRALTPDASLA